ncbi:carcinine hydrolase/isopenicillin-N N-acyltransferase family protein [Solibacillus silvestris]
MTDAELLAKVKNGIGITGTFQDATLQIYIDEVKAFMKSAGVKEEVIESDASVGCIMRGVADLWNYGAGNARLSDYFKMRLIQLKAAKIDAHINIKKIAPYFYKAEFANLDYESAASFFEKFRPTIGACSAVSNGNLFGRNYDWTFDERCSFVVNTSADDSRHATMGMAVAPSEITQEFIDRGESSDLYKIIPFMLTDGINDAGLICEINVVPTGDKGLTFGTNLDGEDLFAMMIPRYVLDYAADVDAAIALLQQRNIFCAYSEAMKQEFHFMLADGNKTAVIEFVNNEMIVIDEFINDKPIITNFYLADFDGSQESLTDYAMGTERFEILSEGFAEATSENAMASLMREVWYTGTYKGEGESRWFSEFVGNWNKYGNLTKNSPHSAFNQIISDYKEIFEHRKRDGATWHSVHTSIYNIESKKLIVIPQESAMRFAFSMKLER